MDNQKSIVKSDSKHTFKTFIRELFSFYKLKSSERSKAEKPKDLLSWFIFGLSEFVGTIFISLGLAGLSIYVADGKYVIEEYLLHPIIVGFFAGFIIVGICLFVFLRWSCDLNPAVTIYRYLSGRNNGWFAAYKIIIQFIGAFVAGAIIYAIGHATTDPQHGLPNAPISSITAAKKAFPTVFNQKTMLVDGTTWIFFVELVMTAILLFPIFSPNINEKYRDLMIMFIISLSVWMGLLGGSAAINPARGLTQQLPTLLFEKGSASQVFASTSHVVGHPAFKDITTFEQLGYSASDLGFSDINQLKSKIMYDSIVYGTAAMLLGDIFAPVFYLFVQGLTKTVVNPTVVKIIKFKNNRAKHIETPEQTNK
ncbi:aquaporin [Mycoplasma sp. Pen4]|uniref:aquaporin n=1 Tax=Mycoplasma sp. Pen4 TaxID=640330 RepID=UPI001653FBCD|nr:aquaporin [Mycoplasma sp. Pen4]QNM93389.1 aquaporin [Mycoplasma sp. Pen4]